jgi:hypothetical protein
MLNHPAAADMSTRLVLGLKALDMKDPPRLAGDAPRVLNAARRPQVLQERRFRDPMLAATMAKTWLRWKHGVRDAVAAKKPNAHRRADSRLAALAAKNSARNVYYW